MIPTAFFALTVGVPAVLSLVAEVVDQIRSRVQ